MNFKIIYEDEDVLAVDKPARIAVFPEGNIKEKTFINFLMEKYPELGRAGEPPRFGIVHRLDKDTSGILLVAKNSESLIFFQKQFKNREVSKKYICLVEGTVNEDRGEIKTLIARSPKDPRRQKVYTENEIHPKSARDAVTEYEVLKRFENYTLLGVQIKTGRRHQIRCHFSYLHHPIAGDKLYGFKNSKVPEGLTRQFLHSSYLKIQLLNGKAEELHSELPDDLQAVLNNLN